jgi:putative hydrolase of the HAD superfamily
MQLKDIEHILIDMDGVLLDTKYDNYFWQEYIPLIYAKKNNINLKQAIKITHLLFHYKKNTKDWYDLDYWTNILNIDITKEKKKKKIMDKIKLKKNVIATLKYLKSKNKNLYLVTNAHKKTLDIKLSKFPLNEYFDHTICSHELKYIKEDIQFWYILRQYLNINYQKSILIEDTIENINSAYHAGLKSIYVNDTKCKHFDHIYKIKDFSELSSCL